MALIHGRYDGFNGFARDAFWGFKGVSDTDAERSWDLLSVFYPEGTLGDPTYCHNCPTDKPLGFYSSTPVGNVNVVPIESSGGTYNGYKAIAFMGYNCAEEKELSEIASYVKEGGNLLLTFAHLTKTTAYEDILNSRLEYGDEDPFGFTSKAPITERKTVNGKPVDVIVNLREGYEIVAVADDGAPIAVRYNFGKGRITLFAVSAYPAHTAISELYKNELSDLMQGVTASESVWAECTQGTQFAIYDRGEERDVYFLAVDWYRDPAPLRTATLRIADTRHTVKFPFGTMIKAAVWQSFAAYPHTEDAEVISVKNGVARLQGTGRVKFTFINGSSEREEEIDFASKTVIEIKI